MTTNDASTSDRSEFRKGLLACHQDLCKVLPPLGRRYALPVLVDAMADHVAAAMKVMRDRGVCDLAETNALIVHLERWAFDYPNASDSTP